MTGTAWWMAPELVPGGKQSDAASEKSDVWYVGIVKTSETRNPLTKGHLVLPHTNTFSVPCSE